MTHTLARLLIAGTGGDSGKTMLSLGLLSIWREEGIPLRVFKKGPDFIDAAWLGWAAGVDGRNLDSYMMGFDAVVRSFSEHATAEGVNLVEGNRGLLDGVDAEGTHSSASLAQALDCPVILVVSPTKVTATAAAVVLGCRQLAPEARIAGVVLNQVAGSRHERVTRRAIEQNAGLPVVGALPKIEGLFLPSRHLGLVPPAEQRPAEGMRRELSRVVRRGCDWQRLLAVARSAPALAPRRSPAPLPRTAAAGPESPLRIGFFRDSAFTFYYPENLEALEAAGAVLVPVSALEDSRLPNLEALYIGGGFPETHTGGLAANRSLLAAVRDAAAAGLPIYAECGGLMYLAEALQWHGDYVPMSGVLPIRVTMHDRPQGHGYCRMTVELDNPFLPAGTELRGHEFHYSQITAGTAGVQTVFKVEKGRGCFPGRDGIVQDNVLASYLHLHAIGTPEWAPGMVRAAAAFRRSRQEGKTNSDRRAAAADPCTAGEAGRE